MELSTDDPQQVGPWLITARNFVEGGRRSYSGKTGSLTADLLLIDLPRGSVGFGAELRRSKSVFTLEIPAVLDANLDSRPQWIASNPTNGERLEQVLEQNGSLTPGQWAELAKTALIGCAALRSAPITSFQISLNTFVVEKDDIHLADMWAGAPIPSPLYENEVSRLSDRSDADDKFAIGRLLALAMGASVNVSSEPSREIVREGFTQEHVRFIEHLVAPNPADRPSTEQALRSIPGRDTKWTVPVFALDNPKRERRRARAQRLVLWGAGAFAIAAASAGVFWFISGQEQASPEPVAQAETVEAETIQIREVRLSFPNEDVADVTYRDVDKYTFTWCYPDENLNLEEIPDRLVFQRLIGDEWETDRDVVVRLVPSQNCGEDQSAITFTTAVPSENRLMSWWTQCQDFRVLIPRLSDDRRDPIRFCLQQREASETVEIVEGE